MDDSKLLFFNLPLSLLLSLVLLQPHFIPPHLRLVNDHLCNFTPRSHSSHLFLDWHLRPHKHLMLVLRLHGGGRSLQLLLLIGLTLINKLLLLIPLLSEKVLVGLEVLSAALGELELALEGGPGGDPDS